MKENFDELLEKIQTELPDLITPEMLINLGLASHVALLRMRKKGVLNFIKVSSARILYLKKDVIEWLRRSYTEVDGSQSCGNNEE